MRGLIFLEDFAGETAITVYPATDRVVIESPESLPVSMVAVTNESGQLLFLQPATSCRTEISVRDLPAGLYVAHVSTSVGSTAIKFVVRN